MSDHGIDVGLTCLNSDLKEADARASDQLSAAEQTGKTLDDLEARVERRAEEVGPGALGPAADSPPAPPIPCAALNLELARTETWISTPQRRGARHAAGTGPSSDHALAAMLTRGELGKVAAGVRDVQVMRVPAVSTEAR
jgi:hypothetical protein